MVIKYYIKNHPAKPSGLELAMCNSIILAKLKSVFADTFKQ
jgi:hypothetical protein